MQAVVNALRVLQVVADFEGTLNLNQLAHSVGLPVSTTHRLVDVLEREHFLFRSRPGKQLWLGPAVRALTGKTSGEQVRLAADPIIAKLNRDLGETVFLSELVGTSAVCFAILEGTGSLRFFVKQGTTLPLHATASGRVLLAYQPEAAIEALIEDIDFTAWPQAEVQSSAALLSRLETIRKDGMDVSADEMDDFAWATTSPIFNGSGSIQAALTLIAPTTQRNSRTDLGSLPAQVQLAARQISEGLGFGDSSPAPLPEQ